MQQNSKHYFLSQKHCGTAVIIFHQQAGRGRAKRSADAVKQHLEANRWKVYGPFMTRHMGHATQELVPAWASRAHLMVVIGGDGTLREVCEGLKSHASKVVLGFIPIGNANVVARELMIPLDPDAAIPVLTQGVARSMDAGIIKFAEGGKETGKRKTALFLAMAEVGYGARIVSLVDGLRNGNLKAVYRLKGDLIYALAGLMTLFGFKAQRFSVEVEGDQPLSGHARAAVFANTETYAKSWSFTPGAGNSDGRLNYMLRKRCNLFFRLASFLAAMRRREFRRIAAYGKAKRITITSERPLMLQIDGDPMPSVQYLEISILPHYLRIMTPDY